LQSQEVSKPQPTWLPATIGGIKVTAPVDSTPPADATADYRLGPGDQITIHVVDLNEIPSTPYRVDGSGFLHVPVIGRLWAQGLTAGDVAAEVRDRLTKELVNPDVTVSIVEFRSQPVSVLGAVANPGVHQLEGRKTLLEMIVLAGGIRPDAGNLIHITRNLRYGRLSLPDAKDDPTHQYSVASVRIKSLMNGSEPRDNVAIQPYDVISVPRGELIYVLGAVAHAGGYMVNESEALTALQIMSLAGGLDKMAAPRQARILRPLPESTSRTEIPVDLRKVLDGKSADVALKPNDVLIVPTSGKRAATLRSIEAAIGIGTGAATATIYRY
jgi:polysaccharide export outer membrane protein